jgi:Lar family restriction alleviation protein
MKLKGCPFCGEKGSVERLRLDVPSPYRVRCDDCGRASGWASGKKEAVEMWSKRRGGSRWRRLCFEKGRYTYEGD